MDAEQPTHTTYGMDKDTTDYWGSLADTYDEKIERIFGKGLRENLARLLEGEVGLGNAIEFGCGTGYFTRVIAKNAESVIATDRSPRMIQAAKRRLKGLNNVTFMVEDSTSPSLPPEAFDTALMANMLHTLDEPLKALKECNRVLKKGGRLIIINYTEEGMGRVERALLFFRFTLNFGLPPAGHWPLTSATLRSLLTTAGFIVEGIELIRGKINTLYARARKA